MYYTYLNVVYFSGFASKLAHALGVGLEFDLGGAMQENGEEKEVSINHHTFKMN